MNNQDYKIPVYSINDETGELTLKMMSSKEYCDGIRENRSIKDLGIYYDFDASMLVEFVRVKMNNRLLTFKIFEEHLHVFNMVTGGYALLFFEENQKDVMLGFWLSRFEQVQEFVIKNMQNFLVLKNETNSYVRSVEAVTQKEQYIKFSDNTTVPVGMLSDYMADKKGEFTIESVWLTLEEFRAL